MEVNTEPKKIEQKIRLIEGLYLIREVKSETTVQEELFLNNLISRISTFIDSQSQPKLRRTSNTTRSSENKIKALQDWQEIGTISDNDDKQSEAVNRGHLSWDALVKKVSYIKINHPKVVEEIFDKTPGQEPTEQVEQEPTLIEQETPVMNFVDDVQEEN